MLGAILAHARESLPDECCGLLIGSQAAVVEAVPARNIADAPATRFLVDPRNHLDARRRARQRGLEVCGFYHSHPRSPASPSARDLAEAAYEGCLYLIVGLQAEAAEVRLFRLDREGFVERGIAGGGTAR